MKNEHVLDLIDDYVDGELDGETLRTVESHLAACAACRKEAGDMKRLTSELRKLPVEIEPPEGFAKNLPELPAAGFRIGALFDFRRNGAAKRAVGASGPRKIFLLGHPAMAMRAAAVLALVICGGGAWYLLRTPSPEESGAGIAEIVVPESPAPAGERTESSPALDTASKQPAGGTGPSEPPAVSKPSSEVSRKRTEPEKATPREATTVTRQETRAESAAPSEPGAVDPAQTKTTGRTTGTGSVSGTVTDHATGDGLFGVNVLVVGTTRGATTDPDGKFSIIGVPVGNYAVRVSAIGYAQTEVKNVTVGGDETIRLNLPLVTEEVHVAGVTITADKQLVSSQATSGAQTVSKEAIESIPNVKNTEDVLSLQKGVVNQGNTLYLRGKRSGDVQYLVDGVAPGTESYDRIYESAFRDATDQPKSTFSIDVDGASYTNIRRFLNDGQRPPADAVRIEEMINYFTYKYPQPEKGRPFSVKTEMAECPWNSKNLLLMVGIRGKDVDQRDIPAGNLVFLIDVSGSMQPANRLPLLKDAFRVLVDRLRPEDRVSIVVYAGNAGLVLPPTRGDRKRTILDAIDGLEAGGSTAGGAGIRLAYEQAREAFIEGGNNRVILATDGDFNVGVSSDEEMVRLIEKERGDGIFLSVIGVGTGNLKDSKMEKIADKGNGNYYYMDNVREAKKVFDRQLSGTLYAIAKDVKIQMEFNPDVVSSYRLVGYENRVLNNRDFRDDTKDAGELGAGHTVTALYEIVPVENSRRDADEVSMTDRDVRGRRDRDRREEAATVSLRYKDPDASTSREMSVEVADERPGIDDASEDLRFAAAVAEFGMVLRGSEFRGASSIRQILGLAEGALGRDAGGYRAEFLRLVEEFERLDGGE